MPPMVCPRHHAIAFTTDDRGWPLCLRCFREARDHAEAVALEASIRAIQARFDSTVELTSRLRGRR